MTIPKGLKISTAVAALMAAGCGADRARDEAVCADTHCIAGRCVERDGEPVCECSAADEALGLDCRAYPPDESGSPEEALTVIPGSEWQYGYSPSGDLDYFRIEANEHRMYSVMCVGFEAACDIMLVSPQVPAADTAFGLTEATELSFTSEAAEEMIFAVRGAFSTTYAVYVTNQGFDAPDAWQRGPIAVFPVVGALAYAADADSFRFSCAPARELTLRLDAYGIDLFVHLPDGTTTTDRTFATGAGGECGFTVKREWGNYDPDYQVHLEGDLGGP